MPILLYGLGALCVLAGIVFAWIGLPDREFSFGNTLILMSSVSVVGGLILIGLGAVVSHLQQLIAMGGAPVGAPHRRAADSYEAPSGRPAGGRIPFPPKPKAEGRAPAALQPELPPKAEPVAVGAPTLPNPDEPPVEVAEQVPLSPPQPVEEPVAPRDFRDEPLKETEPQEGFDKEWPAPPPAPERRSFFGFGRSTPKAEELPPIEELPPAPEAPAVEPAVELPPEPGAEPEPEPAPVAAEPPAERPRDVAVLKSGVVDGMGYTLYVDGSIEAELPQGTLRFASINELREHLEKNT